MTTAAAAAWRTIAVRDKTRQDIWDHVRIITPGDVMAEMPRDPDTGYAIYRAVEALSEDEEP